jgi:hypothetical protein
MRWRIVAKKGSGSFPTPKSKKNSNSFSLNLALAEKGIILSTRFGG